MEAVEANAEVEAVKLVEWRSPPSKLQLGVLHSSSHTESASVSRSADDGVAAARSAKAAARME